MPKTLGGGAGASGSGRWKGQGRSIIPAMASTGRTMRRRALPDRGNRDEGSRSQGGCTGSLLVAVRIRRGSLCRAFMPGPALGEQHDFTMCAVCKGMMMVERPSDSQPRKRESRRLASGASQSFFCRASMGFPKAATCKKVLSELVRAESSHPPPASKLRRPG